MLRNDGRKKVPKGFLDSQEKQILRMAGKISRQKAAEKLGVGKSTLGNFLKRRNIRWSTPRPIWDSLNIRSHKLRRMARTMTQIEAAAELGVNYHTLCKFCKYGNFPWQKISRRANSPPRYNEDEVRALLCKSTFIEALKKLNVSSRSLEVYCRRRNIKYKYGVRDYYTGKLL